MGMYDRAWDKANFARYSRAGNKVLSALGGNVNEAIDWLTAFREKMQAAGLSWTLDTAAKHAWDDPETRNARENKPSKGAE